MIDFLLDYYVWILVVLGVIIVTIIGFLVDSKQKRKKKELQQTSSLEEVKTVEPLPNNDISTNVNLSENAEGSQNSVNNFDSNVVASNNNLNTIQQPQVVNEQVQTVQQPVQNNDGQVNIPLNEQKPHFESKDVYIPTQSQTVVSDNSVYTPKPINAVSINQPIHQPQINPALQQNNVASLQSANLQYGYQNPVNMVSQPVNVMPVSNTMQQVQQTQPFVQQPQQIAQNSQVVTPNMVNYNQSQQPNLYQNTVTPTQSNSFQQPLTSSASFPNQNVAISQPSTGIGVNSNSSSMVQNSQPLQTQTVSSVPGIGINFVMGDSSESNEDDTWKL